MATTNGGSRTKAVAASPNRTRTRAARDRWVNREDNRRNLSGVNMRGLTSRLVRPQTPAPTPCVRARSVPLYNLKPSSTHPYEKEARLSRTPTHPFYSAREGTFGCGHQHSRQGAAENCARSAQTRLKRNTGRAPRFAVVEVRAKGERIEERTVFVVEGD